MLVHYLKVILLIISRNIRQKVKKRGAKLRTALTALFRVSPYGRVRQRAEWGRRAMALTCANSGTKHLPEGETEIPGPLWARATARARKCVPG